MGISPTRRRNLQQRINERAQGNAADFAHSIGRERTQIAQCPSSTYNSGRSIAERVASAIEKETGIETGSLDRNEGLARRPSPEGFAANIMPLTCGGIL